MISVPVATPSRSYEVLIGSGLLARAGDYLGKILENRRAFVVTVPPVRRRWAKVLMKSLSASGIETALLECPMASARNVLQHWRGWPRSSSSKAQIVA